MLRHCQDVRWRCGQGGRHVTSRQDHVTSCQGHRRRRGQGGRHVTSRQDAMRRRRGQLRVRRGHGQGGRHARVKINGMACQWKFLPNESINALSFQFLLLRCCKSKEFTNNQNRFSIRILNSLTLVVSQCEYSCLKKASRVFRDNLNSLHLFILQILNSASTSNTSAGAVPDDVPL